MPVNLSPQTHLNLSTPQQLLATPRTTHLHPRLIFVGHPAVKLGAQGADFLAGLTLHSTSQALTPLTGRASDADSLNRQSIVRGGTSWPTRSTAPPTSAFPPSSTPYVLM